MIRGRSARCWLQVFSIPRVGKSVELDLPAEDDDDDGSFTAHSNDNDNNDDNNVRMTNQQRRNVFSKIPRVGRSRMSSYDVDGLSSL